MIKLNEWVVSGDGTVKENCIQTAKSYFNDIPNTIRFHYDGDDDFITLEKLCKTLDDTPDVLPRVIYMPYFPYSYTNESHVAFNHYASLINSLGFERIFVTEYSPNLSKLKLEKMKNTDVSVRLALSQIRDELKLVGDDWLRYAVDNSGRDVEHLRKFGAEAGIYAFFVSNFDKYSVQMNYKNIFLDICDSSDDCKTVILVDDSCEDLVKYQMIIDQLKLNNPTLKKVIICAAHCTNIIYESGLIKKGIIDKLVTTNSVFDFKSDSSLTRQEQKAIQVFDAFRNFKNMTAEARSGHSLWLV